MQLAIIVYDATHANSVCFLACLLQLVIYLFSILLLLLLLMLLLFFLSQNEMQTLFVDDWKKKFEMQIEFLKRKESKEGICVTADGMIRQVMSSILSRKIIYFQTSHSRTSRSNAL